MENPKRKPTRLSGFDYNSPGAYFITICTQDRRNILSRIVGGGPLDAPQSCLTAIGRQVEQRILSGNQISDVFVDKYVIMPNHVHMILFVGQEVSASDLSPTNAKIPHFVSAFKRFCRKDLGAQIFQRSYHDHIIRGEKDYQRIWQYIDTNPAKWQEDCFYRE